MAMTCHRYAPAGRDGLRECGAELDELGVCPTCPPARARRIGEPATVYERDMSRRHRIAEAAVRDRTARPMCTACSGNGERVQGAPCRECRGWGELGHAGSFAAAVGHASGGPSTPPSLDPWAGPEFWPGTTGDEVAPF